MTEPEKVTLYQARSSYYSQMARLACVEKGVDFIRKDVDILKGENYAPEMVRLNPACEVPFITVGKQAICGSQNIIDHLDKMNGAGQTDPSVEKFRQRIAEFPAAVLTLGIVRMPGLLNGARIPQEVIDNFKNRVNRREILTQKIAEYPELADYYNEKLSRVEAVEEQLDENHLAKILHNLESLMDEVENMLKNKSLKTERNKHDGWLFGQEFTNADIVFAVLLARLDLLGLSGRFWDMVDGRLFLADYYRRLKNRPSFSQECVTGFR